MLDYGDGVSGNSERSYCLATLWTDPHWLTPWLTKQLFIQFCSVYFVISNYMTSVFAVCYSLSQVPQTGRDGPWCLWFLTRGGGHMIQYEPQEKQMSVTLSFCYDLPTILRVSKREGVLVSLGYTHSYDEVFHDGSRLTKVNLIYFARLHRQTQANE